MIKTTALTKSYGKTPVVREPPWNPRTLLTLETRMEHGINRAVPIAAQVPP